MKQVTIPENVEYYQCDSCKKNWHTSKEAEGCEERHQRMAVLVNAIGSTVKWLIEDDYTAEGQIESVNEREQYVFATNTRGERLRVGLDSIRYLNNKWFCFKS